MVASCGRVFDEMMMMMRSRSYSSSSSSSFSSITILIGSCRQNKEQGYGTKESRVKLTSLMKMDVNSAAGRPRGPILKWNIFRPGRPSPSLALHHSTEPLTRYFFCILNVAGRSKYLGSGGGPSRWENVAASSTILHFFSLGLVEYGKYSTFSGGPRSGKQEGLGRTRPGNKSIALATRLLWVLFVLEIDFIRSRKDKTRRERISCHDS